MKPVLRVSAILATVLTVQSAAAHPVTVDSCGEPITLAAVPERAVVHDLNMTEMFFALGLQERMVGVSGITGWYKVDASFSEQLGDIPELAPKYPSMENLIAAEPDFFFAGWYYGMRPGGEVTPETLAAFDVTTLELTESCVHLDKEAPAASMELLFGDMLKLGQIFDKVAEAEALVDGWRTELDAIEASLGDGPAPRVFLYDSGEDQPFTAGRFAIPTAMIEAAGGKNVLDDLDMSWGRTSWEAVAERNPEFLVLLDYQEGAGYQTLLDFLKAHPAMSETDAVKNERFVALRYAELTPGPANIEAIKKIAAAMHGLEF
ncbi:MAG: ABC transporter substrate-binding protein [Pseudomonadota bacterium]